MTPRDGANAFLQKSGWGEAVVRPLAGDASFRRYFRLSGEQGQALLMDAPPEHEDVEAFMRVADALRAEGLSAPEILASDVENGFLLIEDFGDDVVGAVLKEDPTPERKIYAEAVDILAKLAASPLKISLPPYDADFLMREVMLFPEWYAKSAGLQVDVDSYRAAWETVWADVVEETRREPVLTMRDYHVDNLMLLNRPGLAGLGLLDFQDALAGHRAYDLISLLQDARRDVSPALEEEMFARFVETVGITDKAGFRQSYEVLGAQRNVKILGIFVRLRDRDGRSGYVERLPRVWSYLDRNFAHPGLAPVAEWFAKYVPAEKRSAWCQ